MLITLVLIMNKTCTHCCKFHAFSNKRLPGVTREAQWQKCGIFDYYRMLLLLMNRILET